MIPIISKYVYQCLIDVRFDQNAASVVASPVSDSGIGAVSLPKDYKLENGYDEKFG